MDKGVGDVVALDNCYYGSCIIFATEVQKMKNWQLLVSARKVLNSLWEDADLRGRCWGIKKESNPFVGSNITIAYGDELVSVCQDGSKIIIHEFIRTSGTELGEVVGRLLREGDKQMSLCFIAIQPADLVGNDERHIVGHAMKKYGSHPFIQDLGEALLWANHIDAGRVKDAFPDYWEQYRAIGEEMSSGTG